MGKKAGYEDVVIPLKSKINPVAWGNITFVYSWTTDVVSGGAWKYTRDGVYLNMEKKNMQKAEMEKFRLDSKIRHFTLMNYNQLQLEAASRNNGQYTASLSKLSGIPSAKIQQALLSSPREVAAVEKIMEIAH